VRARYFPCAWLIISSLLDRYVPELTIVLHVSPVAKRATFQQRRDKNEQHSGEHKTILYIYTAN